MAEIPIERKERRNWLPLILLALLLLAILGYCFLRPRPAGPVVGADTTRTSMVGADTARGAMNATAGAATGAVAGAAMDTGMAATPGAVPAGSPMDTAIAGRPATAMRGGATGGAPMDTGVRVGPAAMAGGAMAGAAGGASAAVTRFVQFVQRNDTSMENERTHAYTTEGVRLLATALDQVAGSRNRATIQVYTDSMRHAMTRLQRSGPTSDTHANDAKAAFSAAVSAMAAIDRAQGRTSDVAPMRAIYNELSPSRVLMPQLPIVQRYFIAAGQALQAMNAPGTNTTGR